MSGRVHTMSLQTVFCDNCRLKVIFLSKWPRDTLIGHTLLVSSVVRNICTKIVLEEKPLGMVTVVFAKEA